jgi:hypothetical protein
MWLIQKGQPHHQGNQPPAAGWLPFLVAYCGLHLVSVTRLQRFSLGGGFYDNISICIAENAVQYAIYHFVGFNQIVHSTPSKRRPPETWFPRTVFGVVDY